MPVLRFQGSHFSDLTKFHDFSMFFLFFQHISKYFEINFKRVSESIEINICKSYLQLPNVETQDAALFQSPDSRTAYMECSIPETNDVGLEHSSFFQDSLHFPVFFIQLQNSMIFSGLEIPPFI